MSGKRRSGAKKDGLGRGRRDPAPSWPGYDDDSKRWGREEGAESGSGGSNTMGTIYGGKRGKRIADKPAKHLLYDADVKRWYENMYRSSVNNAEGKLRRLNLFRYRIGMGAREFAQLGKKDPAKVEDIMMDHMTWMKGQKYAPSYMNEILKAARSWLEYNRVDLKRKIKVKDADMTTTLDNEVNPTPDQVMEIMSACTPRGRVIVGLMALSGIRPQVIGQADGSDGLRLGDIPELVVDGKKVSFSIMPAVLTVRAALSKTRNKYITFIPKPGCDAILGYLRNRIASGEELRPDSALVRVNNGWEKKGWRKTREDGSMFLCTSKVTGSVRKVIKSIINIRPYALRSYFDTQLLMAESNGCIPHAYRQFFMGHKGDMEARYTTNKGRLTETMREDMRRCYRNSEIFLYPHKESSEKDKAQMLRDLWRQQAASQGLDIDRIFGTDPGNPKPRQRGASKPAPAVDDKEGQGAPYPAEPAPAVDAGTGASKPAEPAPAVDSGQGASKPAPAGNGGQVTENRIVAGDDELLKYLNMGWTMIQEISNGRYIVRSS